MQFKSTPQQLKIFIHYQAIQSERIKNQLIRLKEVDKRHVKTLLFINLDYDNSKLCLLYLHYLRKYVISPSLSHLCISLGYYQPFITTFIIDLSAKARFITKITLKGNQLIDAAIEQLYKCDLKFIQTLILSENHLNYESIRYIVLSNYKYLEILAIDNNRIGNKGIQILSKGCWRVLKQLNISNINIDDLGIKALLKCLLPQCINLNVKDNGLNNQGYRAIIKIHSKNMKFIYLQNPRDEKSANCTNLIRESSKLPSFYDEICIFKSGMNKFRNGYSQKIIYNKYKNLKFT